MKSLSILLAFFSTSQCFAGIDDFWKALEERTTKIVETKNSTRTPDVGTSGSAVTTLIFATAQQEAYLRFIDLNKLPDSSKSKKVFDSVYPSVEIQNYLEENERTITKNISEWIAEFFDAYADKPTQKTVEEYSKVILEHIEFEMPLKSKLANRIFVNESVRARVLDQITEVLQPKQPHMSGLHLCKDLFNY